MRIFIGVALPEKIKEKLYELQRCWLDTAIRKRPTLFNNFHLTIKYIGELSLEEVELLTYSLEKQLANFKSFEARIANIGAFNKGSGQIIWAGFTAGNDLLNALNKEVVKAIKAIKIELKKERYTPHITLARNVYFNDYKADLPLVNETIEINKVTVFQSHRIKGELTYTPLYEIDLQ